MTRDQIEAWIRSNYTVEEVANAAEVEEDKAGLYTGDPDAWVAYGTMPNTDEDGWWFVGYTSDIEAIAKRMTQID